MPLRHTGEIPLPPHVKEGGFDHAAAHGATSRLYVAHTVNDALDVIDCAQDTYLRSLEGLKGVAGALVSDERGLFFTSNRGEDTVSVFQAGTEAMLARVQVGVRPNGLAYDPGRNHLLAANAGDPEVNGSFTVSIVDVARREMVQTVAVPGRTRWTVYDPATDAFYVNIANPAQILVIAAADPARIQKTFAIPVAGPHGLDLDPGSSRLFCACDGKALLTVDRQSGRVLDQQPIAGVPDVIFFNPTLRRLYVAIGDPGVIEVFDAESMRRTETVATEKGAHTLAFDPVRNKVYAFLPQSCRAAVYHDEQ